MKKKLGPLPLYQWALIGVAAGLLAYLYRRGHPAAAQGIAATVTPSAAQYNPIDPTTGLPISGGISTGGATTATGLPTDPAAAAAPSFTDLLTGFGQLEDLLQGLQGLQPGPPVQTDHAAVQDQVGTGTPAAKKKTPGVFTQTTGPRAGLKYIVQNGRRRYESQAGKGDWGKGGIIKKTTAATKNPGHTVTHHPNNKKTPSSSAPHNARQHHNVHPPAHQRHEPAQHPAAQHPAAKKAAPAKPAAAKPAAKKKPAGKH